MHNGTSGQSLILCAMADRSAKADAAVAEISLVKKRISLRNRPFEKKMKKA